MVEFSLLVVFLLAQTALLCPKIYSTEVEAVSSTESQQGKHWQKGESCCNSHGSSAPHMAMHWQDSTSAGSGIPVTQLSIKITSNDSKRKGEQSGRCQSQGAISLGLVEQLPPSREPARASTWQQRIRDITFCCALMFSTFASLAKRRHKHTWRKETTRKVILTYP